MRLAWLVIAIFAARFLVTAIAFPQVDGDVSWQRWLGTTILQNGAIPRTLGSETFSAAGAPWLPQEWLFSIGIALAHGNLGWAIFAGLAAACAVVALVLSAMRAVRRGASARAVAVCSAAAGIALFESFGVRAQVVAWPFIVGFLFVLETDGPAAWLALLVAALWSNLHASAALAPALGILVTAGAWLDARSVTPRVRRLGAISLLSLGAICLNPFGWHLPVYAFSLVGSSLVHNISEWRPTGLDDVSFRYGALPLLVLVLIFGSAMRVGKARWEDLLVVAAFFWLMLSAGRNIAIFSLIALPGASVALTAAVKWFGTDAESDGLTTTALNRRIERMLIPAFGLGLAAFVGFMLVRAEKNHTQWLPNPAVEALARAPGTQRVLCTDFSWCGLLVGDPHTRVFLDGRADPYPQRVWDDYISIVRLDPVWRAQLDAYHVDAIIALRDEPLDQALRAVSGWHSVYVAGDRYRVWLRNPARVVRRSDHLRT